MAWTTIIGIAVGVAILGAVGYGVRSIYKSGGLSHEVEDLKQDVKKKRKVYRLTGKYLDRLRAAIDKLRGE